MWRLRRLGVWIRQRLCWHLPDGCDRWDPILGTHLAKEFQRCIHCGARVLEITTDSSDSGSPGLWPPYTEHDVDAAREAAAEEKGEADGE